MEDKKRLYEQINPDVVVATKWMEQFIRQSPLTRHFTNVHRIPFGVHLEQYGQVSRDAARDRLGISNNTFVIAFRAENSPGYTLKGSQYIWEALHNCHRDITLLTVGSEIAPKNISDRFHIVQLGWVNDEKLMGIFLQLVTFSDAIFGGIFRLNGSRGDGIFTSCGCV